MYNAGNHLLKLIILMHTQWMHVASSRLCWTMLQAWGSLITIRSFRNAQINGLEQDCSISTVTVKITGPQTAAGKTPVGPVNLLYIIMFKIRKIKQNSSSEFSRRLSPVLMHWRYCSLALKHRNDVTMLFHCDVTKSLSRIINARVWPLCKKKAMYIPAFLLFHFSLWWHKINT